MRKPLVLVIALVVLGTLPASAGPQTPLTFAYSSPIGDAINGEEIFVTTTAGGEPVRLTENDSVDQHPAWSPDGTRIAFASERDGDSDIYLMNTDGSDVVQITNARNADAEPSWSPDGTRIAFTSFRRDKQGIWSDIFVMNVDGTGTKRLSGGRGYEFNPAWSPVADKIAYTKISQNNASSGIFLVDLDGNSRRLTRNTKPAYTDSHAAWSADGTELAFTRELGSDAFRELFIKPMPRGKPVRITRDRGYIAEPDWGPQDRILFSTGFSIESINPDGTDRQLYFGGPPAEVPYYAPDWAPGP
jgi:Tol biopolymer transport system component